MFIEKLAEGGLYVMSAPTGAGKSTVLKNSALPDGVVVALDEIRALMFGAITDFDAGLPRIRLSDEGTDVVVNIALQMAEERLKQGLTTIVDGNFLQDNDRKPFAELARRYSVPFKVLIFDVFEEEAIAANATREKRVADAVVKEQFRRFIAKSQLPSLSVCRDSVVTVVPRSLPHARFDIVGDIHGLMDDLRALLDKAGWDIVEGVAVHRTDPLRKLLFEGDATDRGQQGLETIRFIMRQVEAGHHFLLGNHETRLYRFLKLMKEGKLGDNLWPSMANSETGVLFMRQGQAFCDEVMNFIAHQPSSYIFEEEGFLPCAFVHADLDRFEPLQTTNADKQNGHSRYGRYDADAGYQRRFDSGLNRYTLIRGHTPHNSIQSNVFSLERKQVYKGELVLLRFDQFQELARAGDTRAAFNASVVTQVCSFDFSEHQKKYALIHGLERLAIAGTISRMHNGGLVLYSGVHSQVSSEAQDTSHWLSKARGIVMDLGGNIVQHPFEACPTYGDASHHPKTIDDEVVVAVEKLGGDVCLCTAHPFRQDELLTSYKDSFFRPSRLQDSLSPMQEEALIHFLRENDLTLMFAVVEPQTTRYTGCNPGEEGAYLIGARGKNPDDQPVSQAQLDAFAKELKLRRPKWARMPFQQVKARLATSRSLDGKHCIEGYVVHKDTPEQVALFKMKTPAFLASKLLTNLADGRIKFMYANPAAFKSEVHPEVHPLVDKLTSRTNRDAFLKMPAAERKALASSVV